MADQKPPRLTGDERETVTALLQYQRNSFVKKISGINEEAARRRGVPSGMSLLWLIKHMARAESVWLLQRFAGQEPVVEDDEVGPADTVQSAITCYQQTWVRADAVVAAAGDLDGMSRHVSARAVAKDQVGGRPRPPGRRGGVDQVA